MTFGHGRGVVLGLAVGLAAAIPAADCRADDSQYGSVLAQRSPALVTLKYVLKLNMGGMMGGMGEQEMETEATGVMIDPHGVVLCSNTQLLGFVVMFQRAMRSRGMGDVSATPTDMKVLIGDDVEGRDAELIARDSELDLAWIRIADPGDAKFEHVEFKIGPEPGVGDPVVGLRRLDRYFGRSAVLTEGRIGGVTQKPRHLYVPTGDDRMSLGAPVFSTAGYPIGLVVSQAPDEEDAGGMEGMMAMLSGMQEGMAGMILPAGEVEKATRRALETAGPKAAPAPGAGGP